MHTENPGSRMNTRASNPAVSLNSDTTDLNRKCTNDQPYRKSQHFLTSRPSIEPMKDPMNSEKQAAIPHRQTRGVKTESQEMKPSMKSFDKSIHLNKGIRQKDELSLANLSLRDIDEPHKQGMLSIQTNALPPISTGEVYLCKFSCKPENLTNRERQWLIKGYIKHFIRPNNGRMMLIGSQSFLTDYDIRLEQSVYHGIFRREVSKFDTMSKPIHFDSGLGAHQCMWSRLTTGSKERKTPSITKIDRIKLKEDGSPQTFEAYASVSAERLNIMDFCTSNFKNQKIGDLDEHVSVFDRLVSGSTSTASGPDNQDQLVVHGGRIFDFGQAGHSIGFGLEARKGALAVVRATEKGLVRVVNPCQRIFFAGIKMSDFMTAHWPNHQSNLVKASAHMTAVLRGLRVWVRQVNGDTRLATVSGVTCTSSSDTYFKLLEGKRASRITVEEYFTTFNLSRFPLHDKTDSFFKEHGVSLTCPTLPCIIVGSPERPQFFPSCRCSILPGQSFRKNAPLQAEVNFHRFKKNVERCFKDKKNKSIFEESVDLIEKTAIVHGPTQTDSLGSSYLSKIPYQFLSYSNVQQPLPLSGRKLPLLLIFVEISDAQAVFQETDLLMAILKKKLTSSGNSHVMQSSDTCKLKLSGQKSWKEAIGNRIELDMRSFSTAAKIGYQSKDLTPFVIAIIDGGHRNKETYGTVKSYFDVTHGLLCTFVNRPKLEKACRIDSNGGLNKYASSLLSKILAKAGIRLGYTQPAAEDRSSQEVGNEMTLLVGFHLAYPPPPPKTDPSHGNRQSVSQQPLLISVATKPLGLKCAYRTTTVIQRLRSIVRNPSSFYLISTDVFESLS